MRLSKLLPVFLIALASCSVESSKDSSSYPEWEYTMIKKELARFQGQQLLARPHLGSY